MTDTRQQNSALYEIGVDIGGTFTDVVCRSADAEVRLVKIPTTRANPSAGVRHAVEYMMREWGVQPGQIARFVHGTTAATNAVLERKGAKLGLLATQGFKDVIEIGRQNRHAMYDLALVPQTPVFLVPGALRKEVRERITASGDILTALDEESVRMAVQELLHAGVQAIAVSYLFSFLNPAHELRTREIIHEIAPDIMVSISSEVDPAFREYERTCITAFDAYIKPGVDRYLAEMERDLIKIGVNAPLQLMQSRGGIASSHVARRRPVRLFLSGPAAGVIGGRMVGQEAHIDDVITVDIGGTSSDIALISQGKPMIAAEGIIDTYAVRVPMVDVNAIGAGGGSIAWIDGAGGLKVGPLSAGSEPGPACYGRGGDKPTVTDASVVLGYVNPDYFAGGMLKLEPELAWRVIEQSIAKPLGMSVEQAAFGIHRVVNSNMAEGIRLVSVGRGVDPRQFALLPLGGGGPIHANALARELGMRRIIVPLHPGVLSAAGLLDAPVEHEMAISFPYPLEARALEPMKAACRNLDEECLGLMAAEGIERSKVKIFHFADVCYVGQSYYLEIPIDTDDADPIGRLRTDFLAAHNRVYGHSTDFPAQIVNLRTIHQAFAHAESPSPAYRHNSMQARKNNRKIMVSTDGYVDAQVFEREALAPGALIQGPAIIEQTDTTIVVEPGWQARVVEGGNLLITTV
ncbi:hydantoinase/oxoprolinase family protein [Paralcaligenes sp. KSB-10]|uniref:hydantoinase/oxoprolinase family protein n=1 Tax=Paralcaligenes sp. KSB-10 TaxID=2901142 RepID=UPI001E4F47CD|nr:hydantoinase/oxoprolinase family protein [Paralcaligenes sp. KSB-10]UHL64397.1 hydantoinase/oxoprolinase family protein [Paralcaligenes sp. KSB-10]